MKKTILFLGLVLAFAVNVQAQTPSHDLAKLFHGKQVDRVVDEIYNVTPDSTKQAVLTNLNSKREMVLDKMASIYSEQLTVQEIQMLLSFYTSPLAQKWNGLRGELTSKNLEAVMEWGMELRERELPPNN